MKRLLSIFPLLLALAAVAAIPSLRRVTLAWDPYYISDPDLVFKVYEATSATGPWTVNTNLVGSTNTRVSIMVAPGVHFYYLTASNFWGESDPSNAIGLPPAPVAGILRIER